MAVKWEMSFQQMIEAVGCISLCPQAGFFLGWFMGMFWWLLPQLYLSHYCLSDPALPKHTDSMLMFSTLPLLARNSL